jgi:hypothetical protein
MSPSKSSLDRLPKACSAQWEAQRHDFEAQLRAPMSIPETAVTVAVSLDGVMTPMKDGARSVKREGTLAAGKRSKGPAGYQEVGCATLSFYDTEGERLSTVRMARMPETKKATVKTMLAAELAAVLQQRPALHLVKLADGAKDNWTYLGDELPRGRRSLTSTMPPSISSMPSMSPTGRTPRRRARSLKPIGTCCAMNTTASRRSSAH